MTDNSFCYVCRQPTNVKPLTKEQKELARQGYENYRGVFP